MGRSSNSKLIMLDIIPLFLVKRRLVAKGGEGGRRAGKAVARPKKIDANSTLPSKDELMCFNFRFCSNSIL